MSIVHTLKKVVDPIRAREEEAERRTQREQPQRASEGDPPGQRDVPLVFVCRVCGHEGPESEYCPECLADTMEAAGEP
jgi:rubrerythrin